MASVQTPSSTVMTRSRARCLSSTPSGMPTPESGVTKSAQKKGLRGALFDKTNDSPVIGLIPIKSPAKLQKKASDSPGDRAPAGEDVLRAHISSLLGLPVESSLDAIKEVSAEKSKQGDLRSPAQRVAPTPANSPAYDPATATAIITEVSLSGHLPSPNTLQAAVATARAKIAGPVPDALVIATPVGRVLAGSSVHQHSSPTTDTTSRSLLFNSPDSECSEGSPPVDSHVRTHIRWSRSVTPEEGCGVRGGIPFRTSSGSEWSTEVGVDTSGSDLSSGMHPVAYEGMHHVAYEEMAWGAQAKRSTRLHKESHEVFIDDDDVDYEDDNVCEGEFLGGVDEVEGLEEVGEGYEEAEGKGYEEGEGEEDGSCAELCTGMGAMNLTTLKGLPAPSGTHIRFEDGDAEEKKQM